MQMKELFDVEYEKDWNKSLVEHLDKDPMSIMYFDKKYKKSKSLWYARDFLENGISR